MSEPIEIDLVKCFNSCPKPFSHKNKPIPLLDSARTDSHILGAASNLVILRRLRAHAPMVQGAAVVVLPLVLSRLTIADLPTLC